MSDTNNIVFDCPECKQGIKATVDVAGKMAACPNCGKDVQVPESVSKKEVIASPFLPQPNPVAIAPTQSGNTQQINKKSNGMSIAGLLFGIISVVPVLCCGGPIWAILGIIFSSVALRRISKQPDQYEGEWLAIAGLITSVVGLMINLFVILILGFTGATMAATLAPFLEAVNKLPK